jgi:hypothetical protein
VEGEFDGSVVSWRDHPAFGRVWLIRYDDGDQQEADWPQLRKLLRPPLAAAHAPAHGSAPLPGAHAPRAPAAHALDALSDKEDAEETAHAPHQAACAPAAADAAATATEPRKFKGVSVDMKKAGAWRMDIGSIPRITIHGLPDAETAARKYDDIMRGRGCKLLNFPRPGSDEVQAVAGKAAWETLARAGVCAEKEVQQPRRLPPPSVATTRTARTALLSVTERMKLQPSSCALPVLPPPAAAARAGLPPRTAAKLSGGGGATPAVGCAAVKTGFLGVYARPSVAGFTARFPDGRYLGGGSFATAEAAARAHDAEARLRGALHRINFPENAAERAAAEEYKRLGRHKWCALHGSGAAAAVVPLATPLPRKRDPSAQKRARVEDDGGAAGACSGDDAAAAAAPHPMFLHGYCGVSKSPLGGTFRAHFPLPGGTRGYLGHNFGTAEDAARAHDEEARSRGALHRINFPMDAAERVASAEYRRVGPSAYHVLQRSRAATGAAAAAAPLPTAAPRKRGLPPRAQQLAGSAHKQARVQKQEEEKEEDDESGGDFAAVASYSDMDADAAPAPARSARKDRRQLSAAALVPVPPLPAPFAAAAPAVPAPAAARAAGAAQSELQRVEAFLRGIRPPLSQARLLALLCCVRVRKRVSS